MLFVCACSFRVQRLLGVDLAVAPDGGFKDVVVRWCGRESQPSRVSNEALQNDAAAAALVASFCLPVTPAHAYNQNCRLDGFDGYRCSGGIQV